MLRRLRLVLIALAVALAATLPAGVRAMPMPALANGAAIQQPCTSCAHQTRASPGNHPMPVCPVFACVGAVAVLPDRAPLPGRVLLPAAYAVTLQFRWRSAVPAPDPFPPRPATLV